MPRFSETWDGYIPGQTNSVINVYKGRSGLGVFTFEIDFDALGINNRNNMSYIEPIYIQHSITTNGVPNESFQDNHLYWRIVDTDASGESYLGASGSFHKSAPEIRGLGQKVTIEIARWHAHSQFQFDYNTASYPSVTIGVNIEILTFTNEPGQSGLIPIETFSHAWTFNRQSWYALPPISGSRQRDWPGRTLASIDLVSGLVPGMGLAVANIIQYQYGVDNYRSYIWAPARNYAGGSTWIENGSLDDTGGYWQIDGDYESTSRKRVIATNSLTFLPNGNSIGDYIGETVTRRVYGIPDTYNKEEVDVIFSIDFNYAILSAQVVRVPVGEPGNGEVIQTGVHDTGDLGYPQYELCGWSNFTDAYADAAYATRRMVSSVGADATINYGSLGSVSWDVVNGSDFSYGDYWGPMYAGLSSDPWYETDRPAMLIPGLSNYAPPRAYRISNWQSYAADNPLAFPPQPAPSSLAVRDEVVFRTNDPDGYGDYWQYNGDQLIGLNDFTGFNLAIVMPPTTFSYIVVSSGSVLHNGVTYPPGSSFFYIHQISHQISNLSASLSIVRGERTERRDSGGPKWGSF